jgi:hypothetical protein
LRAVENRDGHKRRRFVGEGEGSQAMTGFRWAVLAAMVLGAGLATPALAQEVVVFGKGEKTQQWVQKLLIWRSWYTPGSKDPAQTREAARNLVEGIHDPAAIPAILAFLKVEKDGRFRHALVWPLIQMGGPDAIATLVKLSVLDDDLRLRYEVAVALACRPETPDYLEEYISFLYKPPLAARAAQALHWSRLATRDLTTDPIDPRLAKALIAALVQPEEKRLPFSTIYGGPLPEGAPLTGFDVRWREVEVPTPNPHVYETLKAYSLRDHGYDQARWTRSLIYSKRR